MKQSIAAIGGLMFCFSLVSADGAAVDDRKTDAAGRLAAARELADRLIIVDTHIDVPYRIYDHWADVTQATDGGDFDYPRGRAGGLDIPFMSIFVPWQSEADGTAFALANRLIDQVEAIAGRAPERFTIVGDPKQARAVVAAGRIALAMGMENGAPLAGSLDNLRHFQRRGIRYITLAHSRANHLADSSFDPAALWQGLSPFGRQVVAEMNRLGIMVDVSHLSDAAIAEVLEVSKAPVIASHSSARHFTPGWQRNISDELISGVAAGGGVIMINFGSTFISRTANDYFTRFAAARDALKEQLGVSDDDEPRIAAFIAAYHEKFPFPYATVEDVADHIDHVVKVAGVDHVGLGSDFDGVGDSLPIGLKDVSMYPNLIAILLERGYRESDLEKILGGNLLRVWETVARQAR